MTILVIQKRTPKSLISTVVNATTAALSATVVLYGGFINTTTSGYNVSRIDDHPPNNTHVEELPPNTGENTFTSGAKANVSHPPSGGFGNYSGQNDTKLYLHIPPAESGPLILDMSFDSTTGSSPNATNRFGGYSEQNVSKPYLGSAPTESVGTVVDNNALNFYFCGVGLKNELTRISKYNSKQRTAYLQKCIIELEFSVKQLKESFPQKIILLLQKLQSNSITETELEELVVTSIESCEQDTINDFLFPFLDAIGAVILTSGLLMLILLIWDTIKRCRSRRLEVARILSGDSEEVKMSKV